GSEVWVFDPQNQERLMRIALKEWGLSIAVSRGLDPLLMVTNPITMALEMYDAQSGEYIKTITDFGQETPLMMHGAR
ncbi:MAG: methylamine dehydrogenase, partial [Gammaproteobacteria bacterium]